MSAQINLYHPRFLKQRDPLALGTVVLVTVALYALLAAAGGWAWNNAERQTQAAAVADAQLRATKDKVDAATKAAGRKASPQLLAEAERAEAALKRRGEILRMLEGGAIGSTGGFADYLRGFARQTPEGLWLTAFNIGAGGIDMEIRGSTLDPAVLPEFIRRLGVEKVFQGRSFAALTMNRVDPPPAVRPAAQVAAMPAPTVATPMVDFVLLPKLIEAKEARP